MNESFIMGCVASTAAQSAFWHGSRRLVAFLRLFTAGAAPVDSIHGAL